MPEEFTPAVAVQEGLYVNEVENVENETSSGALEVILDPCQEGGVRDPIETQGMQHHTKGGLRVGGYVMHTKLKTKMHIPASETKASASPS